MRPGALELSIAASEDVVQERAMLDENWRQRLERARTQAAWIERQYQTAEPENRLVTRTLERRWEKALLEVRLLEEEYARFRQTHPVTLTRAEVDQIRELARDLPALWEAPTTTPMDRQRIIRFLVDRVEVAVDGVSDRVRRTITWAGGQRTEHELTRPIGRYEQTVDFEQLMARIRELRIQGHTFADIADHLNTEGFRPHKGAGRFHKDIVSRIVRRRTPGYQAPPKCDRSTLGPNEWFVIDLSRKVGIAKNTLHAWRQRGWVSYCRPIGPRTPCVCWADSEELGRLRRLARTHRGWWEPAVAPELTTPKVPPPPYRKK